MYINIHLALHTQRSMLSLEKPIARCHTRALSQSIVRAKRMAQNTVRATGDVLSTVPDGTQRN